MCAPPLQPQAFTRMGGLGARASELGAVIAEAFCHVPMRPAGGQIDILEDTEPLHQTRRGSG